MRLAKPSTFTSSPFSVIAFAEQKKKYAAEITTYDGVPDEPVSASELIRQQQEILAVNAENQRKRRHRDDLNGQYLSTCAEIEVLSKKLTELEERRDQLAGDLKTAQLSAQELTDQSTSELEQSIRDVEQINAKIRANLEHDRAEDEEATGNKDIVDIDAYIYCEKDSHKGIVIGKGGAMLKKVATEARTEIESFLDIRINLQCWVKVRPDLRNKSGALRNFGFTEN
jgi:GTPase Era involved in 16S rRNA processing